MDEHLQDTSPGLVILQAYINGELTPGEVYDTIISRSHQEQLEFKYALYSELERTVKELSTIVKVHTEVHMLIGMTDSERDISRYNACDAIDTVGHIQKELIQLLTVLLKHGILNEEVETNAIEFTQ